MEVVTLYWVRQYKAYQMREQGEGWQLKPWNGNTPYYEGETVKEALFTLPDSYELRQDEYGDPIIVEGGGIAQVVTIGAMPVLVTSRGQQYLKRSAAITR